MMAQYFDYVKHANAAGIPAAGLRRLEEVVRTLYPTDQMMFELRMLRTVRAIAAGRLSVEEAVHEFGAASHRNVS